MTLLIVSGGELTDAAANCSSPATDVNTNSTSSMSLSAGARGKKATSPSDGIARLVSAPSPSVEAPRLNIVTGDKRNAATRLKSHFLPPRHSTVSSASIETVTNLHDAVLRLL